jgi:GntR family transcriptional repressor for pyruvate dehydrogenase complex
MNPEINQRPSMQSVRAFEEVSSKIKAMIFRGVMKPGDRLPSEAELANQFQVGRQSVREALRILEFSGFIKIQKGGRNSGAIIQDTILKTISNLFLDALAFERLSLDHLTIARLEIEKRVVFYTINNACEKDYLSLEKNISQSREKIALKQPATEENIRFHQLLAQASGNRVFAIVIGVLLGVLRDRLSQLTLDLSGKKDQYGIDQGIKRSRQVVTYHEDILQAIRRRNHELAETLMEEHLVDLRDRLLALEIDGK